MKIRNSSAATNDSSRVTINVEHEALLWAGFFGNLGYELNDHSMMRSRQKGPQTAHRTASSNLLFSCNTSRASIFAAPERMQKQEREGIGAKSLRDREKKEE